MAADYLSKLCSHSASHQLIISTLSQIRQQKPTCCPTGHTVYIRRSSVSGLTVWNSLLEYLRDPAVYLSRFFGAI